MTADANVRRGAIIGFGNVAANGHLPGWKTRSDFQIVAIVDPDPERRALAADAVPGARTYPDVATLLQHERLDFVDIAAPPVFHPAAITAAAQAGVHVLCEKPLTTSLPDYLELKRAVERAGVVLHTIHNWKHSEAFQLAQRVVAAGQLGSLRSIVFDTARNGCSVATGENWRVDAAVAGGGILVDHGWHAFYLMLALAQQRPQRIRAALERRRYVDAAVEDTVTCAVDFPSVVGEIRLTWAAEERHTRWQLSGDAGELEIDDDRVVLRGKGPERVRRLASPLSAGSHHPDWFGGVITEFRRALDDPDARRVNRTEAELCGLMLSVATTAGAKVARPLPIPEQISFKGDMPGA